MAKPVNRFKNYHSGYVKKTITVNAKIAKIWRKISDITSLSDWVIDVKKTIFLSKKKRGIGAIRKINFKDGNIVEEHVVRWEKGKCFSYIAVSGLPLRVYHATISIKSLGKKSARISWESYLNSKKMTKKEFGEFLSFIEIFYQNSLKNLKSELES